MGNQKTKNLVTGGAGFLGFHLCKRLLNQGEDVICLDDLSTGVQEHVDALARFPNFEYIHHDVVDPISLKVDCIFNLACPASPPAYQKDPIKTTLTSVLGARNMLDLAAATNARILQASTSEVYGDPLEHPQTEAYRGNVVTMGPRACYDEGKRCAETLFYDYHRVHGVDIRVARIFNTYGPGMRTDDGRVVSNFIEQAILGYDLTVYGDGAITRSFCYVDDLVDGLIRLMNLEQDFVGPVNLGNSHELSIGAFARMVIDATGSNSQTTHLRDAVDDPHVRCPDITKALAVLGWAPKISLEQGLAPTIEYFRQKLSNGGAPQVAAAKSTL